MKIISGYDRLTSFKPILLYFLKIYLIRLKTFRTYSFNVLEASEYVIEKIVKEKWKFTSASI